MQIPGSGLSSMETPIWSVGLLRLSEFTRHNLQMISAIKLYHSLPLIVFLYDMKKCEALFIGCKRVETLRWKAPYSRIVNTNLSHLASGS